MIKPLEVVRSVPFFRDLDEATLGAIVERCHEKVVLRNETLFVEGDPPRGLIIVRQGSVKIYKVGTTGREQILEIERAGSSVAELPLFDGMPYPASCAAVEDSVVLIVPVRDFHALLDAHPAISKAIIATLAQRMRRMVQLVRELSLNDVRGRLADLLLELAGDAPSVELPWSQQEIAARIGTVREIVSRMLARLVQEGAIRVEGRTLTILDRRRLRG